MPYIQTNKIYMKIPSPQFQSINELMEYVNSEAEKRAEICKKILELIQEASKKHKSISEPILVLKTGYDKNDVRKCINLLKKNSYSKKG